MEGGKDDNQEVYMEDSDAEMDFAGYTMSLCVCVCVCVRACVHVRVCGDGIESLVLVPLMQ